MSGSFFFGMDAIMGHRTARQRERLSHILYRRLCEAKQDDFVESMGGGSAPALARAPRTQRRTARKTASSDDGDSDGGDGPAFTISTSPTDGMVVGTATLNTAFILLTQYGGKAIVPIEDVCADYFARLTLPNLRRKISSGEIPLPLVRMEAGSKKAAQGVYLQDLAEYIDSRRAAAVKERDQLCN